MRKIPLLPSDFLFFFNKKSYSSIKKLVTVFLVTILNTSVFSQFYAGNNFTDKGVSITPGHVFKNNFFAEAETLINGTNDFVLTQYSLFAGKQFIITGNREYDERYFKINTAIGATLKKSETVFMTEKFNPESNTWSLHEAILKTATVNLNVKLELVWYKKPFDYFIVFGYNNANYTGIGWRGYFKKK